MTNEELERLCKASLDARKIENAGNRALQEEADKLAGLCPQTIILSLIQRVKEAEDKAREAEELFATPIGILTDKAWALGRAEALEEAADWHEAEITRLEDQIEHNNEYARRSGNFDGKANDFCRSLISNHRSGATAIRALGEKAG